MDSWRVIIVVDVLISVCVSGTKWEAITDHDQWYINLLYEEEWNADPPAPSDPATTVANAFIRHQICERITRSGAFKRYGRKPFEWSKDYAELQRSTYADTFNRIYSPTEAGNALLQFEYTNVYTREIFRVKRFPVHGRETLSKPLVEYVFVCLLTRDEYSMYDLDSDSGELDGKVITPIYVSKIYNPDEDGRYYNDHRFIFMRRDGHDIMMLVEEPGEVHIDQDFNVELQYLERRRYRRREPNCLDDAVCELNTGTVDKVHTFRLCSIILTAGYFKDRIVYPRRVSYQRYFIETIAFQTEAGRKRLGKKKYRECTLQCWANMTDGDVNVLYVSRAYKTNELFVYVKNRDNGRLYLEAWIRNVRLVREDAMNDDSR